MDIRNVESMTAHRKQIGFKIQKDLCWCYENNDCNDWKYPTPTIQCKAAYLFYNENCQDLNKTLLSIKDYSNFWHKRFGQDATEEDTGVRS